MARPDEKQSDADFLNVGPGFFETMKMPITLGRNFMPAEFTMAATASVANCSNASIAQMPVASVVNDSFVHT